MDAAQEFDKALVNAIHEVLEYSLGETNTRIIYNYLEERGLPLNEIPNNLEMFSDELRKILGFGSRQIYCAAVILEETILEVLCKKLEIPAAIEKPVYFPLQVKKLKEKYINNPKR